ncbi:putative benzoate 4-monooxygenase cytochrome P450 [Rosellinia necatrix]|uniref:Putative benzoate 4-monooxygenase cytochrome P450 n=1 Tax=Rosellinia necatrix TaxID=77044 RepID=A0A1S7UJ92_ROSNE|nr:putative benzoate 4-monooxygenase cytochrome P450 [Rosellinia necatrix]
MLDLLSLRSTIGIVMLLSFVFSANVFYNLFFHPLAKVPGPVLGRMSGIPSWYYACRGDRHLWLMKQFEIYGNRIRPEPNTVVFRDWEAHVDIYSMKSNVRRSHFYSALNRDAHQSTTLTTIDVGEHARRRKRLSLCFTERSIRASSSFVIKHVNRWIQLITEEIDVGSGWSPSIDFSRSINGLIFDIMGDLCFGTSFNIKEPGEDFLKSTPHNIASYMKFHYSMCRFPLLKILLWLKPHGLDRVIDFLTPTAARKYNQFVADSVTDRISLQAEQAEKAEAEKRQDMFHFLAEARDPGTGAPAYNEAELRGEANLLIIAASDTTSISLSGIMFYLTNDPPRCQRLAQEIRTTFSSADEIVPGPKLMGCTYLRACIDEGMRLCPSGPSELPREVLPGGLWVKGEFYPAGTVVGTSPWANSRNRDVYGDPEAFRPERWIPRDDDCSDGAAPEALKRAKAGFYPFLSGPGNCIGQNLAMVKMLVTIARMLHQLDVRRAPGSTLGGGRPGLGWGQDDPNQFQLEDAYLSLRRGPEVQFRKRQVN